MEGAEGVESKELYFLLFPPEMGRRDRASKGECAGSDHGAPSGAGGDGIL